MARIEENVTAVDRKRLNKEGDSKLFRVEKLEILRPLPSPEDDAGEVIFTDAVTSWTASTRAHKRQERADKHS
jgi:hypothetical protein